MRAIPTNATLPQLINHYRTASAGIEAGTLDDLTRHTYHSMAIDGYSLTLTETQALLQHRIQILGKPQTDQWAVIDHHQALQQMLSLASQHEPINLITLQQVAATLMYQTGELIHSLLSSYDTRKGELRIDSAVAGRRLLVAAHKLPAALTELLREVNTRITQLKTPRQIYDLSFTAHFQLLTLHPFGVGNGRLARLLMSYIQHYHQLPLSLVYVDNRPAYLTRLESCWQQKTTVPIVGFMHSQLLRLLQEGTDLPPYE